MSKLVFLKERHELGEYEPDVHQTNIGSGWELLHYTGNIHTQSLSFAECCAPYEQSGCDQQYGEVHSYSSLKVERFEEGGGVGHQQQQQGGQVGRHQLVSQPPLEHDLHLQTSRGGTYLNLYKALFELYLA